MTINITFVLQMIHFLVAYWLMNRLFFRQAFLHIQAENEHKAALECALAEQKKGAELTRIAVHEQWQQHQKELRQEIPSVAQVEPIMVQPSCLPETHDHLRKERLVDSLKNLLIKRALE